VAYRDGAGRNLDIDRGETRNIADRQFAVSGRWALASDGLQRILQRKRSGCPLGAPFPSFARPKTFLPDAWAKIALRWMRSTHF
jgi:hypothetical protein